jgi:dipeptidase E
MKTIVAIGGGELGELETLAIDREMVKLSGKKHPMVLFIPTASKDSEKYWKIFQKVYGEKLGCKTDVLFLVREKLSRKHIEEKILSADIVYVGGGNTLRMMKIWRKLGVDQMLRKAWERGVVMAGLSAGAICWFRYGVSDSRRFSNPNDTSFMRVRGLDFIHATASPHHVREKKLRDPGIKNMMLRTSGVGLTLDDNSALIIEGGRYRVMVSEKGADACGSKYFSRGEGNLGDKGGGEEP